MTWKLPSHLEPYREFINNYFQDHIEVIMNKEEWKYNLARNNLVEMIDLLQRLYEAKKLK